MMINFDKLYELIQFILLGLVQGLTEPLPISSSGHVLLVRELFSVYIPGLTFEIVVNFGSLIAIMIVYRQTISQLSKNFFRYLLFKELEAKDDFHYCLLIILATIPLGLLGMFLKDWIQQDFSSLLFVGISLMITGGFLWMIRRLQGSKLDKHITIKEALIIGLAQTIALVPGISRAGTTIVAGMLLGLQRETALRFSFMLYIPVSLGVTLFSLSDVTGHQALFLPFGIAAISSLIATYIALKWFIQVMKEGKLIYFTYYCLSLGLIVLIWHHLI